MQNIKQKASRTTKVASIIMLISKVGTPRLIQIQYNVQANPTNNAEYNSHDLGENYYNQSVGGQNNVNQNVGGQNNVNQSVGGLNSNDLNESVYSKHDGKSKFKKKVTVIAGDPL